MNKSSIQSRNKIDNIIDGQRDAEWIKDVVQLAVRFNILEMIEEDY